MPKGKKVIQNPEKIDENMRLRVSQVPVMNDKIIKDLVAIHKMPIMQVRGIIDFIGRYTANIITSGTMETVMLPGFGKIAPNIRRLQGKTRTVQGIKDRTHLLSLALRGKNTNFVPQINPIDYTGQPGYQEYLNQQSLNQESDGDHSQETRT